MSKSTISKTLKYIFSKIDAPTLNISFFGGEPTMAWDEIVYAVGEALLYADRNGTNVSFSLTTNGSLLTDDRAKFLSDNNFAIVYSFDGFTNHRKYQSGKMAWPDIARSALKITQDEVLSKRCTCALQVVPGDVENLFDYVLSAYKLGFSCVALNKIVDSYERYSEEDYAVLEREFDKIIRFVWQNPVRSTRHFEVQFFEKTARHCAPRELRKDWRCGAAKGSVAVGPNGKIYVCHRATFNDKYVLGDIDAGIDDSKREEFLSWDHSKCATCFVNPCSTCIITNFNRTGSEKCIASDYCRFEILRYKAGLKLKELRENGA